MLNPRYHSNYGKVISVTFRALTSPLPLRSNTEGVYSANAFWSSDSEGMGHWKDLLLPRTTRQLSETLYLSDRLHHSRYCDIQIYSYFSALKYKSQEFLKKFFDFPTIIICQIRYRCHSYKQRHRRRAVRHSDKMVLNVHFSAQLHKKIPKCDSIPGFLLFVNLKSFHFKTA